MAMIYDLYQSLRAKPQHSCKELTFADKTDGEDSLENKDF